MGSFTATDSTSTKTEKTWFTPPDIIRALGPFDLDVCTMSTRPFDTATKHIEHDKGQCAFQEDWEGNFVWMNPPYGKEIKPFIHKFIEHKNGIALTFARMGTDWMQNFLKFGHAIYFLRKRIAFIDKHGVKAANAGADSCLLVMGEEAKIRVCDSKLAGTMVHIS